MELATNTSEFPQTSGATTMEAVDIFFDNEVAREAYLVLIMLSKPAGKCLSITSLARLNSWMARYSEYIVSKNNGLHRVGNETMVLRNRDLELLPVAM